MSRFMRKQDRCDPPSVAVPKRSQGVVVAFDGGDDLRMFN